MKRMNAINTLKKAVNQRCWYNGTDIHPVTARRYKQLILSDKISYKKACELLKSLGFSKIQDEIWR